MLLSKCSVCNIKKLKFLKKQQFSIKNTFTSNSFVRCSFILKYKTYYLDVIYRNEMGYGGFKDLTRRKATDKAFHDKSFNFTKNKKYHGYQNRLASWFIPLLIKERLVKQLKMKMKMKNENENENENSKKELAEELHKPITRKFEERKVHSPFKDDIWGADLADMQLISKFNKGF